MLFRIPVAHVDLDAAREQQAIVRHHKPPQNILSTGKHSTDN